MVAGFARLWVGSEGRRRARKGCGGLGNARGAGGERVRQNGEVKRKHSWSRRAFLKLGAAGPGVVARPQVVTTRVWGAVSPVPRREERRGTGGTNFI